MASARRPNVLLVEDEPLLREMSADRLRDEGFEVLEAEAASEALALLARNPKIDLLFTDVHIPGGIDGLALAAEARRMCPDLPVILTSGKWAGASGEGAPEGAVFVQKPYSVGAVAQLVKALVKQT